MVANCHALFQLADSLDRADRFYFTLREQGHNEFIDQGLSRLALESDAKPRDPELRRALDRARTGYESVCVYVLDFFDVFLKLRMARRGELVGKFRETRFGGDQPHVEHLAVGATGPEPYRDGLDVPPELRQIRQVVAARGIDATLALLKRWREKEPTAFLFHQDCGFALVDESLGYGHIDDAIAITRFYSTHDPKFAGIFLRTADSYRKLGLRSFAADLYRKASLLDPTDAEAASKLKQLQQLLKK
jgi:hypothetical protein